ncbi:LuxR C-terminal-related transcriptional regulator [Streptomyces sp. NBC_00047]|uniref:ATP-binding protein n=1 Tax=Streptomyces sp. NBC_00047 TaxID=2975627 RepID=UPI002B1D4F71|nr:LuxR C-terminal-related transcriptional regulator [Streptomyces sp. NBC_00047]
MRVGREQHHDELREWVRGGAQGGGGCLTVEGEPGAGRTAFVREALAQAAALGCRVRYAAADALAVDLPLRAVLDCVHPAGPARAAVVGLLREAEAATEPGGALLAAMDLLTAGVEEWCAQRPLLLVLDDAHWADAASLLLWRRLAGTAATGRLPLMLAATRRPLPRRPGAERLCAAVGGRTVRLEPLTAAESAELIRDLVGAPPGPRLREAAEQAGGNPRLLRELLAQWSGLVRVEAGCAELSVPVAELPAPPASLGRGLDWLSGPARTTLRHAALLGPSFTAHELALVQARPARELLADLEEPLAAGLLEDTGDLLRFRHPALRRVLSAETPGALRAALHQDAARAFSEAGLDPARTAGQLVRAGRLSPWAVRWLADAAPALIAAAPGAAAELLERAIAQGDPREPRTREALEEQLADAALMLRRPESAGLLEALRARTTDPDRRAAVDFKLVSALMIQGDMARSLDVTERALAEEFPSAAWRLRLEACRVLALADLHRAAEAFALAGPLVARARRLADPLCAAEAHHALSYALFHLGRGRDSLHQVAEGIVCARRSPAANDMRLLLLANQAEGHMRFDEPEIVAAALREARELAAATGSTGRLVVTEARLAEFHYRLGDWDEALSAVARACALPVSDGWLPVVVHGLRALVLGHRGEREAAQAELAGLPDDAFATPGARRYASHVQLARALLAERDGRPADALRALRPGPADGAEAAEDLVSYERPWVLSEIVRLALESGESGTAREAVAACGRIAAALPDHPGPALALLRCRGLFAQDPDLLAEAVLLGERGGWPLMLGHTLEDLAVARAWHGDLAGSRSALTRAVAAYEDLGARWDVARADARLRSLGVRRGSRSARRRPANGWEALTPAELKVALLVAQGRSNPEIASALFLSRRTVQTHVSHILAKLQVRSRAAVAAQAAARASGAPGP